MQVLYVIVALVTGFSLLDYFTARKWQQVTSNTRNEVVFAHRNKAYGAYVLRSNYNKRMVMIMAGLVLFAALSFGISELIKLTTAGRRSSTASSTSSPPTSKIGADDRFLTAGY